MAILLVYVGILLAIVFFGILFYTLSVQSRKTYTCPACGERVQMEHLEASHCNTCGAPLDRSYTD